MPAKSHLEAYVSKQFFQFGALSAPGLNSVVLRPPVDRCPGRLASTLTKSAFGLLRSAFGLARTVISFDCIQDICCVCREDICCIKSQDICCSSRKDTRHLHTELKSTTPWGGTPSATPQGVVDEIQMAGVFSAAARDVLALDATDAFSADTTDVMSAAKAASGGSCPELRPTFNSKADVQ